MPKLKREIQLEGEEVEDEVRNPKRVKKAGAAKRDDFAFNGPFLNEHEIVLGEAIVKTVLAAESTYYKEPGLISVSGHGGDKINKQVQVMMKDFCKSVGVSEEFVEEAMKTGKGKVKGDE